MSARPPSPLLAAHTYELSYIFPGFRGGADVTVKLNPLQEKLSDEMIGYFANVAQLAAGETKWSRFDPKQDNFMTFILPKLRMVSCHFADFHHCAFWDRTGVY
jgi:para-nitrobenzyl esterase